MGKEIDIQQHFFQMIRERMDPRVSLVDEIAELLQVSNDSAYRRLRSETLLTFVEIHKLCVRFGISLDSVLAAGRDAVVFDFRPLNAQNFDFHAYLQHIRAKMKMLSDAKEKEMTYMANDIPLFHLMHGPEVAAFKLFFWQKTILDFPGHRNMKFKLNVKDESINEVSRDIRNYYCAIPSSEIYNPETVDTSLKQIEYYHVSGLFEIPKEALVLIDALSRLVDHIQLQCEVGFKFKPQPDGSVPEYVAYPKTGNLHVYYNEVIYTDNAVLAKHDQRFISFLTSNGISVLSTDSERYFNDTSNSLEILKRKSTLISGTSEKERNRVFHKYKEKIRECRERIAKSL